MENLERLLSACRHLLTIADENTTKISDDMLNTIMTIRNESTAIIRKERSLPDDTDDHLAD